jgi:hypothetical protein
MLTWQKATTVRRIHFFFVDQAYAVAWRDVCSSSTILDGEEIMVDAIFSGEVKAVEDIVMLITT